MTHGQSNSKGYVFIEVIKLVFASTCFSSSYCLCNNCFE